MLNHVKEIRATKVKEKAGSDGTAGMAVKAADRPEAIDDCIAPTKLLTCHTIRVSIGLTES